MKRAIVVFLAIYAADNRSSIGLLSELEGIVLRLKEFPFPAAIREVNRRPVRTLDGYRSALTREEGGLDLLLVQRGETFLYVAMKPKT